MDNTCIQNVLMDAQEETIDSALKNLRLQIRVLEHQNIDIQSKLDEENKKGFEMTKLLRARRPFNRTITGEFTFPGKKEMILKLDIMSKELLKLRSVLDGFKRDRCQFNMAQKIFQSINCIESNENVTKKQLTEELNTKYNKMKIEFDECVLEISKYRVKMDDKKKELEINEKRLENTQLDYDEAKSQLARIEKLNSECHSKETNFKKQLDNANTQLDCLKSVAEVQMNELNVKNKLYMNAIHEKEYQLVRANNLCKEKTRMTAECEYEFNRVNDYFKKRLEHVEHLPSALQAVQEQLTVQKKMKTSVEKIIENLSKHLNSIVENPCGDSRHKSKLLAKLKAQNICLKKEREEKENKLTAIQNQSEKSKYKICQQKARMDEIKAETTLKIEEIRFTLRGSTEEYLHIIDKLQNQVSKIEAYSCFEDEKLKLVSSMMQNQIDELVNGLKNAQEQINEIENLQKYFAFSRKKEIFDCALD